MTIDDVKRIIETRRKSLASKMREAIETGDWEMCVRLKGAMIELNQLDSELTEEVKK